MKYTIILALTFFFLTSNHAQNPVRLNKYSYGIELDVGSSFSNFDREQNRWRGAFYSANAVTFLFANRIHQNWTVDAGIGLSLYLLNNRGPVDNYLLDFASPHLSSGISYHIADGIKKERYVKLSGGLLLGYQGNFSEQFISYQVEITGQQQFYSFLRPEIGIRRSVKKKIQGRRYNLTYAFAAFFRYNFQTLGTVRFTENNFAVTLEPRGNIIGLSFKLLVPAGRKRLKLAPSREKPLPPIIYHPRY